MTPFRDYHHLVTTRPHDVQQVMISDLHLSASEPALVQAFLSLLSDLQALPHLRYLYILGDWFDAWIGDDAYLSLSDIEKASHWITPLIEQLKQLRLQGCDIFVMHGNRDFLIGQPFCNTFGGLLIDEPYDIQIGSQHFRLEHGDALCTDDHAYQRFRKLMRNRLVQWYLLNKSLEKRQKIAAKMRQKSKTDTARKTEFIMDVNEGAVAQVMLAYDGLLHGHTHRPDIHPVPNSSQSTHATQSLDIKQSIDANNKDDIENTHKTRYVLGDWRVLNSGGSREKVEAVIGVVVAEDNDADEVANDENFMMVCYTN